MEDLIDGDDRNQSDLDQRISNIIEIYLVKFINASCNICLLDYYVIGMSINFESHILIFYYYLQLEDRCQKIDINNKCYMIKWYCRRIKRVYSLIFPIIMSNYPVELTAGKIKDNYKYFFVSKFYINFLHTSTSVCVTFLCYQFIPLLSKII